MTDKQFEKIKKGLNFHSEGGIDNLCTMTETTLRKIVEDAVKTYEKQQKIDTEQTQALQKQNGELTDKVKELEAQIEKMKCCYNCANDTLEPPEVISNGICEHCKNHDKWELEY